MTRKAPKRQHPRGRAQQQQLQQALAHKQRELQDAEREVATLDRQHHAGQLWLGFLNRMLEDRDMRQTVFGDPSQETEASQS